MIMHKYKCMCEYCRWYVCTLYKQLVCLNEFRDEPTKLVEGDVEIKQKKNVFKS